MARANDREERELIRRCRNGEEEAWRVLVTRYQNMVYAIARRIAGPAADDAAQETFLRLFRKLHTYKGNGEDGGAKFSSWLYRVAYNTCCDVAAKRGREVPLPEDYDGPDNGAGPDELAARQEHVLAARGALAKIRPEYRTVLELYYLVGKSYEQVAEIAELPLGTVKSYIHRGKKAVLTALREAGVAGALAGGV